MSEGLIPPSNWRRFIWSIKTIPLYRRAAIINALSNAAEVVLTRAKTYYLTGGALKVRTGRLRSSVSKSPVYTARNIYYINVGTNVFYGKYWEEGFERGGKTFRRPWLSPAIADSEREVKRILRNAGIVFRRV